MATFNRRKFTSPDALRAISPERLCTFLGPWRTYLQRRGLDPPRDKHKAFDCEVLSSILMAPDADVPKEMIDALYYVHETASDEDMDALIQTADARGIQLERDLMTTPADVAIQVWLVAPDLLRERHAESVALRQKNFLYYGGTHGGSRVFPEVNDELRRNLELALDEWFEQHRRGRGCRVFFFPRLDNVWILVRHGLPPRREASHQEDGRSTSEFYRPQQHDVLIYDTAHDEIGVHANTKGEIKLYLTCFGRLIFGDEGYFPKNDKYSLSPLVEQGANSLLCEDVEGLEAIRLVEFRRFWGGAYQEIEIRRATDIFSSFGSRGLTLGTSGRLASASFKVRFSDSPKERSVTIRPPSNARYERNEDSETIEKWLANRGFTIRSKAQFDDEAPSEVLEGAGRDSGGNHEPTGMAQAAG